MLGGCQPGGIHPVCGCGPVRSPRLQMTTLGLPEGFPGISCLQNLTTHDNRWVYRGCSLLTLQMTQRRECGEKEGGDRRSSSVSQCIALDKIVRTSQVTTGGNWYQYCNIGFTKWPARVYRIWVSGSMNSSNNDSWAYWWFCMKRLMSTNTLIFKPTNWACSTRQYHFNIFIVCWTVSIGWLKGLKRLCTWAVSIKNHQ